MRRPSATLVLLLFLLPSALFASDSGVLPVTHALTSRHLKPAKDPAKPAAVTTLTKYKDASGRTVSTAETNGNLTTHRDLEGKIVGYSIVSQGRVVRFDARGRVIR